MKYVVFDMEWNQTYGRELPLSYGRSLTGEIIEIGAVRLSENFKYEAVFKTYVRPKFYKKLHSMVKRLTGITPETLEDAPSFPEALAAFREFCTDDFVTMTWGDSDMPTLRENIEAWRLPKWTEQNYNLQNIYMKSAGLKNCIALENAAENLGINAENVQYHDAACDAAVTAEISRRIDTRSGIAEYKAPVGELSDADIVGYEKIGGVVNMQKLRADPRIRFTPCPVCSEKIEAERIIPMRSGKKIAVIECPEHGKFLVRFRTVHVEGETFNVFKTVYCWNENVETLYSERLADANEKKEKFLARVRAPGKPRRRRRKKKEEKEDKKEKKETNEKD